MSEWVAHLSTALEPGREIGWMRFMDDDNELSSERIKPAVRQIECFLDLHTILIVTSETAVFACWIPNREEILVMGGMT